MSDFAKSFRFAFSLQIPVAPRIDFVGETVPALNTVLKFEIVNYIWYFKNDQQQGNGVKTDNVPYQGGQKSDQKKKGTEEGHQQVDESFMLHPPYPDPVQAPEFPPVAILPVGGKNGPDMIFMGVHVANHHRITEGQEFN
jgi:hypothetical protein